MLRLTLNNTDFVQTISVQTCNHARVDHNDVTRGSSRTTKVALIGHHHVVAEPLIKHVTDLSGETRAKLFPVTLISNTENLKDECRGLCEGIRVSALPLSAETSWWNKRCKTG